MLAVDPTATSHQEVSAWTSDRHWMDQVLQQHLQHGKHHMKKQANQLRSEHSFEVGDLVFLKLQPYVQTSLAPRLHQKLAFRFFGPFRILARIGTVAYKLELPAHSSIHPVFHVSQLKKAVGANHQVIPTLPTDFALHLAPEKILQTRSVLRGTASIPQVLVKWNNLPADLATWEDYEAVHQGGSVSSLPNPVQTTDQDGGKEPPGDRPTSRRPKKLNTRYYGEQWV
jgi:hypothetical protein